MVEIKLKGKMPEESSKIIEKYLNGTTYLHFKIYHIGESLRIQSDVAKSKKELRDMFLFLMTLYCSAHLDSKEKATDAA